MKQEGSRGPLRVTPSIEGEDKAITIEFVDVDQAFFERYHDPDLPYTKAGDLLFLSMAKEDACALITEDRTLYRTAEQAGVQVFTIDEYLRSLSA